MNSVSVGLGFPFGPGFPSGLRTLQVLSSISPLYYAGKPRKLEVQVEAAALVVCGKATAFIAPPRHKTISDAASQFLILI
jgi:hypothetical protein